MPETTNNDTFDINKIPFKFTGESNSAETAQNAPQSFLGGGGLPTGTNQSESRGDVLGTDLDALLGIKDGGGTNVLVGEPTHAEKLLASGAFDMEKKVSSDPLADDSFEADKARVRMISPDFRKRD